MCREFEPPSVHLKQGQRGLKTPNSIVPSSRFVRPIARYLERLLNPPSSLALCWATIPFHTQIILVQGLDEALGRRGRNVRNLFICCAGSSSCCPGCTACLRFAIPKSNAFSYCNLPPDSSLHISSHLFNSDLLPPSTSIACVMYLWQQRGQTLLSTGHSLARSRTATTGI